MVVENRLCRDTHKHKCYKSFAAREEVLEKIVQRVYRQRNNAIKDIQQQQQLFQYFRNMTRPRALTRILKTGVPEPSFSKSGSPTIQKNVASFKK